MTPGEAEEQSHKERREGWAHLVPKWHIGLQGGDFSGKFSKTAEHPFCRVRTLKDWAVLFSVNFYLLLCQNALRNHQNCSPTPTAEHKAHSLNFYNREHLCWVTENLLCDLQIIVSLQQVKNIIQGLLCLCGVWIWGPALKNDCSKISSRDCTPSCSSLSLHCSSQL